MIAPIYTGRYSSYGYQIVLLNGHSGSRSFVSVGQVYLWLRT